MELLGGKMLNMTKNIHISKHKDGGWKVESEGAQRSAGIFDTQAEAIRHGTQIAKNNQVELFIHGRNGKIRKRNTFGPDPFPPKG